MSTFEVKIRTLRDIKPHADRLDIAFVDGFRVVTQRGRFKEGALAIYVPEGGVVPELILKASGFWYDCRKCGGSGKIELDLGPYDLEDAPTLVTCKNCKGVGSHGGLAGSNGDRVKPIKLQGIVSEGILLGLDVLDGTCEDCPDDEPCKHLGYWAVDGVEVGEILGIEKYVVPIPTQLQGKVYPLAGTIKTNSDPENFKKVGEIFEPGEEIVISSKIHGTALIAGKRGWEYFVTSKGMGSKGLVLEREDDHGTVSNFYHRCLDSIGGYDLLGRIAERFASDEIFLYGEAFPSQDLRYGAEPGTARLVVFDIRVGGRFLTHREFQAVTQDLSIPAVPILYEGPYRPGVIEQYTDGKERISGFELHMEEGCVAKSALELRDSKGHRKIVKSISEAYLTRKGGSEFN